MEAVIITMFVIAYFILEREYHPKPPEDMTRPMTEPETTDVIMMAAAKGYTIVDKTSGNLILKKGSKVVNIQTAGDMYHATMPSFTWYRAGAFVLLALLLNMVHSLQDAQQKAVKPAPAVAVIKPMTAADFIFDEKTLPVKYQDLVVKAVNKIKREDMRCRKHIEPSSTSLSGPKSKPGKPVFYVTCGEEADVVNVFFTPEDISNGKVFKAPKPIESGKALGLCHDYVAAHASYPRSVNYMFGMANVTASNDGTSTASDMFTARNAFGMEKEYSVSCSFDETTLTSASIF